MKEHFFTCHPPENSYQITYKEWGNRENPHVLICVHGLTRNHRDFDQFSQILQQDYRLICPSLVGHGNSDWLKNSDGYDIPFYLQDLLDLLNALNLTQVDWLGTSLGGIIGMNLAGKYPDLIKNLILNDIGAFIPQSGLREIAKYLKLTPPKFSNLLEAETYIRYYYQSFGNLTDPQWQIFTQNTLRKLPEGCYIPDYDPRIGDIFPGKSIEDIQDISLREIWEKITCPVLVLQGKNSNLLLPETLIEMGKTHPKMDVITWDNCGHAPALMDESQIKEIRNWLEKNREF